MTIQRLWHTIRLWTIRGDRQRAEYAKRNNIYRGVGENVGIMDRKVPLYSQLIEFHNNIQVASGVSFLTHDATNSMLSRIMCTWGGGVKPQEIIGCIEIMDNVFIGSHTLILSNVRIGPNAIVAAGSVITKDVPPNSVVAGVPAKVIGTFDSYMEKRKDRIYPAGLRPIGQEISPELVDYMWKEFTKKRK